MRLRTTAAVSAFATALLATPAYAADSVTLTIEPQQVTVTSTEGATQTIHIEGQRDLDIVIEFTPAQPPGFTAAAGYRRFGACHRSGGAAYTCDGAGDVTLTYPATAVESTATYQFSAWAEQSTGRAYGSVVVQPPPEPTPTVEPTTTAALTEAVTAPPSTPSEESPSPSALPSSTPTAAQLVAESNADGGIPMIGTAVAATFGLVALAGAVVAVAEWRAMARLRGSVRGRRRRPTVSLVSIDGHSRERTGD